MFKIFISLFAHDAMSPSVSVNTFQDADAVFDNVQKSSDIIPFIYVTEADIQPGLVFLCHNPLADKITWGMAPTMLVNRSNISHSKSGKSGDERKQRNTLEVHLGGKMSNKIHHESIRG